MSLPGYTYQCALKYTDFKLQTLQDKDLILLIENNIHGGVSSVMGDRYVKSDENQKIIHIDAANFNGHSLSQLLPYDEIEMWHGHSDLFMNKLEENINTPVESNFGSFIGVDLNYPYKIKEETKNFRFFSENKVTLR